MSEGDERRHDLFLTEGTLSFHWRLTDRGITLAGDRLGWMAGGVPREHAFADIASIRLQRAMAGNDSIGLCLISFRDGSAVNAHGGGSSGLPDDEQARAYSDFVRDLHRRLAPDDRRRIAFQAGIGGTRRTILTVAMIAGALLFVVLPIVLLVVVRSWEVLFLALGAAGFAWPAWRLYQSNQPRNYSPDLLPDDLV